MERDITDGDHKIGANLQIRLVRTIAVCAILGTVINFGQLTNCSLGIRLAVFATILFVGLLAWLYLEIRNQVIARRDMRKSLRWKIAALAVHPALIPVYLIGVPIAVIVLNAWMTHRNAEQAVQPATRCQSKSEGGQKPQPEVEGRSR